MPSPYLNIPESRRAEIIRWLDHRLSALLAVAIGEDYPRLDAYLQLHRYVYNAALEGASIMARMLFEFLGVLPVGRGGTPAHELRIDLGEGDDFRLANEGLPVATREDFQSRGEEDFIARLLWGINKRTAHCTIDTTREGTARSDLIRATEIILRELRAHFYGPDTLIEINADLARDLERGWRGFNFRGPLPPPRDRPA